MSRLPAEAQNFDPVPRVDAVGAARGAAHEPGSTPSMRVLVAEESLPGLAGPVGDENAAQGGGEAVVPSNVVGLELPVGVLARVVEPVLLAGTNEDLEDAAEAAAVDWLPRVRRACGPEDGRATSRVHDVQKRLRPLCVQGVEEEEPVRRREGGLSPGLQEPLRPCERRGAVEPGAFLEHDVHAGVVACLLGWLAAAEPSKEDREARRHDVGRHGDCDLQGAEALPRAGAARGYADVALAGRGGVDVRARGLHVEGEGDLVDVDAAARRMRGRHAKEVVEVKHDFLQLVALRLPGMVRVEGLGWPRSLVRAVAALS